MTVFSLGITNCQYSEEEEEDGDEYVILDCSNKSDTFKPNKCYKMMFQSDSNGTERLNVKSLQSGNCQNWDKMTLQELARMFPNVRKLDVSNFGAIDLFIVSDHLDLLIAANNQIESFAFAFISTNDLKAFDLSDNNITTMEQIGFATANKISEIYLQHNKIFNLDNNPFECMSELKVLDLSYNDINVIPDHLFVNNKKLEFLKIDHNNIVQFQCNNALKVLDLSYNNIREIPDDLFVNNTKLEILRLSHNHITRFQCNKSIIINYNQLTSVYSEGNFTKLKELDLSGNQLTEIDSVTPRHFPVLKMLNISNNKFSVEYLDKYFDQWRIPPKPTSEFSFTISISLIIGVFGLISIALLTFIQLKSKIEQKTKRESKQQFALQKVQFNSQLHRPQPPIPEPYLQAVKNPGTSEPIYDYPRWESRLDLRTEESRAEEQNAENGNYDRLDFNSKPNQNQLSHYTKI